MRKKRSQNEDTEQNSNLRETFKAFTLIWFEMSNLFSCKAWFGLVFGLVVCSGRNGCELLSDPMGQSQDHWLLRPPPTSLQYAGEPAPPLALCFWGAGGHDWALSLPLSSSMWWWSVQRPQTETTCLERQKLMLLIAVVDVFVGLWLEWLNFKQLFDF